MPELFDPDVKERKTNFKILSILDILYNIVNILRLKFIFFFQIKTPDRKR